MTLQIVEWILGNLLAPLVVGVFLIFVERAVSNKKRYRICQKNRLKFIDFSQNLI